MRRPVLASLVALASLASCTGPEDCTISSSSCGSYALTYTVTPTALTLAVGDTASIGISVKREGRAVTPELRWASKTPTVVAIDGQTVAPPRVRVQATGVGASYVEFAITVSGQVVTGAVPVTVTAR